MAFEMRRPILEFQRPNCLNDFLLSTSYLTHNVSCVLCSAGVQQDG